MFPLHKRSGSGGPGLIIKRGRLGDRCHPGIGQFDQVGYRGYLTFEYFHPYSHYPEALIEHTSDALDRMLGRK